MVTHWPPLQTCYKLEDYVEDCFNVDKYRNLYSHIVHSIVASQMWDKRNSPDLEAPYAQKKTDRLPEHKRSQSLNAPLPESQLQQIHTKYLGLASPGIGFTSNYGLLTVPISVTYSKFFFLGVISNRCKTCKQLGHNATTCRKRIPREDRVPKPQDKSKEAIAKPFNTSSLHNNSNSIPFRWPST
ncbi:hypothetical protein Cgig2_010259 [Carnegiea gigantea]|uniref:Uncharacterized protein n=1 Tax=Carnegiea gigantea TaxID=171969 RepID=A0A9Q1K3V4_9CARY|nr:hypothetical protein Cgig2_010259 [Carnegiea gigantea]